MDMQEKGCSRIREMGDRRDSIMVLTPTSYGPVIGHFQGKPIYEFLAYGDGEVLWYSGVAPVEKDGSICLNRLRNGERLVSPGLVYEKRIGA